MSATDMYDCTHGPKRDCHACLVGELVEALEWALSALDRGDGVLEYTGDIADGERARAVVERAKLIEDCIPAEQAAEVAMDHGHD